MNTARNYNVIVEMIAVGRFVKVTAVDTRTGIEASIVGDPRRGERALKDAAVKRLHYVLRKHATAQMPDRLV